MMKRGLNEIKIKTYIPIVTRYLKSLKKILGQELVGVILFGSVARGEADPSKSDIDFYIIANNWPKYFDQRFRILGMVFKEVERSPEYKQLLEKNVHVSFSEYPLNVEEFKRHGPLDLEVYADGIILYEKGKIISKKFGRLERKLKELGAKRITEGGERYWILKERMGFGEVIEI